MLETGQDAEALGPSEASKLVCAAIAGALIGGVIGSQLGVAGAFGAVAATVPFALFGCLIAVLLVQALS